MRSRPLVLAASLALFATAIPAGRSVAATAAEGAAETRELWRLLAPDALAVAGSPAAVEAWRVVVDPARLIAGPARLTLPLPDAAVEAALGTVERRGPGDLVWRGRIESGGRAVITLRGGYAAGVVYAADGLWELVPHAGGGHLLLRLDPDLFPRCAGAVAPPLDPAPSDAAPAVPIGVAGGTVEIDVMALYTPEARDGAGGVGPIEATVQAAVDMANTAFADSLMSARLNLVHTGLADRNDSGNSSADLAWVSSDPEVAVLRDLYGADMVSLIVGVTDACGRGFVMRNPGPGFAAWAFQITARSCAVGNLSYAHEHGHNLGFEHDPANGTPPGNASFPWSFGHFAAGQWRTVMSYADECSPCPRVPHFSNPDVTHAGSPTGIADQRDNARTGDFTAPIAAAFRASLLIFADGFESGDLSAWQAP